MILRFPLNTNQFKNISTWLYQEWEETGSGFYSNIESIEKSFLQHRILGFEWDDELIGFLTWHENAEKQGTYIDLEVMAIHPRLRFKGIGEKFYKLAENFFARKGFLVIKLFCAPAESQFFWQKMGYLKHHDIGYGQSALSYYKPIIPYTKSVSKKSTDTILELWDVERHWALKTEAKWIWNLDNQFKAIVQPANSDWYLRLTVNSEIVNGDKVKFFTAERYELQLGTFLYINREKLDWLIADH